VLGRKAEVMNEMKDDESFHSPCTSSDRRRRKVRLILLVILISGICFFIITYLSEWTSCKILVEEVWFEPGLFRFKRKVIFCGITLYERIEDTPLTSIAEGYDMKAKTFKYVSCDGWPRDCLPWQAIFEGKESHIIGATVYARNAVRIMEEREQSVEAQAFLSALSDWLESLSPLLVKSRCEEIYYSNDFFGLPQNEKQRVYSTCCFLFRTAMVFLTKFPKEVRRFADMGWLRRHLKKPYYEDFLKESLIPRVRWLLEIHSNSPLIYHIEQERKSKKWTFIIISAGKDKELTINDEERYIQEVVNLANRKGFFFFAELVFVEQTLSPNSYDFDDDIICCIRWR